MQPKSCKQSGKKINENIDKDDVLACKFPGLAIPNEPIGEVNDPISDVMAELEAKAPTYCSKYDNSYSILSSNIIIIMLYL